MKSATHILMRLENIHRRARRSLRRAPQDAFIKDNLEAIESDARHGIEEAREHFGAPGRDAFHPRPTSISRTAITCAAND